MRVNIPLKKEKNLVNAILERPQESRRRSRGSTLGGFCWWEDEEEIKDHFADVGKMMLNDGINRLFLVTRNMISATIGTWINV